MLVYQRVFREPWEPPTVRWCWNTAHAAKHIVNVGHSKFQSAFLFGLLRADSDGLIGHSLLQWFVISSLKCLFFHWMSMNQPCFFSKHPDLLGKKNHLRYTWLTPLLSSGLLRRVGSKHNANWVCFCWAVGWCIKRCRCCRVPPNFFWSPRGGWIFEEKWGGWF